jgi:peptide/nickel transport system ATP-binding protein/oligopeptide transport system ATP-binding protein
MGQRVGIISVAQTKYEECKDRLELGGLCLEMVKVPDTVLDVNDLKTYFFTRRGHVKAVDGVSFSLSRDETLGLVGESGCGKSITVRSILRLVPQPAGRIVGGRIVFCGEDLLHKSESEMRLIRGKRISMVFQDPMSFLNPVLTVGAQVAEPISIHQKVKGNLLWERVRDILRLVGIPSPEIRVREYPHQMSGGMRQRIIGAMALSCHPQLLIADEPTTALDVITQAQFLELVKETQRQLGFSMIMVTHDLGIVAKICDRVAVMYAGRIVESARVLDLFDDPLHPYTVGLLNSLPRLDRTDDGRLHSMGGEPPIPLNMPPGCVFAPRCEHAMDICEAEYPPESTVGLGHSVRCWCNV